MMIKKIYLRLLSFNCRVLAKLISRLDRLPAREQDPFFEALVIQMVSKSPLYGLEAVRHYMLRNESCFKQRLPDAPRTIQRFEDLLWLFSCNQTNAGIISMAIDEAAYLYTLAHSLPAATCLEVGRFKGGSTFLLAAALDERSTLLSVDNGVKMADAFKPGELDAELRVALARYGFEKKTTLVVAESTSLPAETQTYDFVFIDGDHSYEGVRKDWLHFRDTLKPGGHVVFHDAGSARSFALPHEGVQRLMKEIEANEGAEFVREGQVGTLVHFKRIDARALRDRAEPLEAAHAASHTR